MVCLILGVILLTIRGQLVQQRFVRTADETLVHWFASTDGTTHPDNAVFSDSLFEEIGIALIVAGLIGFFVEGTLRNLEERRRHQEEKELATNVFKFVLGSLAPPWITRELKELFKIQAMRTEVTARYNFSSVPSHDPVRIGSKRITSDDLVKLDFQLEYELRNLTEQPIDPQIRHAFEPTVPGFDKQCCFQKLRITQGSKPLLDWNTSNHNSHVEVSETHWNERVLMVKSFTIEPHKPVKIILDYACIRWRHDHDSWMSRLPADQLSVEVNATGLPRIEFNVVGTRRHRFIETDPNRKWVSGDKEKSRADKNNEEFSENPGGVLPFEGFTLHWHSGE
jgi:hypothetical protein